MSLHPDTYRLLIYIATLGLTLIAGFLLGMLTSNRRPDKQRPYKVIARH